MDIEKKQKHHDKVYKKLRGLLDKEQMDLVAFVNPADNRNVILRLVEIEDLDKFHIEADIMLRRHQEEVEKDIQNQIKEQIKDIEGKGDKIGKERKKGIKVHI